MPFMSLHRNYTLVSLAGRVITFNKNDATWVPPEVVKEALAIGAENIDETGEKTILGSEEKEVVPLTAQEREAKIKEAFKIISGREQRGDFTGQGAPNVKVMSSLTGIELTRADVDPMWEEFRNADKT